MEQTLLTHEKLIMKRKEYNIKKKKKTELSAINWRTPDLSPLSKGFSKTLVLNDQNHPH